MLAIALILFMMPVEKKEIGSFAYTNLVTWNEGSKLKRVVYWVNPTDCPIQIDNVSYWNSTKDRQSRFNSTMTMKALVRVDAYRLKIIGYNPLGEYVQSFKGDQWTTKEAETTWLESMEWRDLGDDFHSILTGFAYVDQIRLEDGTIWQADREAVAKIIADLKLQEESGNP